MLAQLFSGVSPFKFFLILTILVFNVWFLPDVAEGILCGKKIFKQKNKFIWPLMNKTTCGTTPVKCICQTLPNCSSTQLLSKDSLTANFSAFQVGADIPPNKKNPTTRFGLRPPQQCLWQTVKEPGIARSLSLDGIIDSNKEPVPLDRGLIKQATSLSVCSLPALVSESYMKLCKKGDIYLTGKYSPAISWCNIDKRVNWNHYVAQFPFTANVTIDAPVRADISMNCTYKYGCTLNYDNRQASSLVTNCPTDAVLVGPTMISFIMYDPANNTAGTSSLIDENAKVVAVELLCLIIGDVIIVDTIGGTQVKISICEEFFVDATKRTSVTYSFQSRNTEIHFIVFTEGFDVSKWSFSYE